MYSTLSFWIQVLIHFYLALSNYVAGAEEVVFTNQNTAKRKGYIAGDIVPVTCLNRTIDTGEHITDSHGNLQYIPFPICNETSQPLSFEYLFPQTQTCTIDLLPDELYHLLEFFVHSDVPLTCRVPSYPLQNPGGDSAPSPDGTTSLVSSADNAWTPFTIALQGTLQLSHLHLHTNINVLFHTSLPPAATTWDKLYEESHIIASTAYSLPTSSDTVSANSTLDPSSSTPAEGTTLTQNTLELSTEGTKILRNAPLTLTFNIAWIDGPILPGAPGQPLANSSIVNNKFGLSLLSLSAMAASAGVGAMAMLIYERRGGRGKRTMNGILGGNTAVGGMGNGGIGGRSTGYGGYGGYVGVGKRD